MATRPPVDAPSRARQAPYLSALHPLGHLPEVRRDPLGLFMRALHENGDVVRLRTGPLRAFIFSHPDHVQRVLVGNLANYTKQTRGYIKLRLVLGEGLVTSEGELWKRQRRIVQPSFHPRRVAGFAETMTRCADALADAWEPLARRHATIDVADEMMALTLRVACLTLFSHDVGPSGSNEVSRAMGDYLSYFTRLVSTPLPFPEALPTPRAARMRRGVRTVHAIVDDLIARRRRRDAADPAAAAEATDLLGMLMAARDEETGEAMSDRHLRDEVVTMLLAGHETTANALTWAFHLLGDHPEVVARLEAELAQVLGGRTPTWDDFPRLTYTGQVLEEVMRLYPPVYVLGRRAEARDVVGGFEIPQGAYVFISQYAMHRHPDYWPDPERFDPDRFAPGAPKPGGGHRGAWFPFSIGQRLCIGEHFARLETRLVLATLAQRFRLGREHGFPVVPQASVTLRPEHGLQMRLSLRANEPAARERAASRLVTASA